MTKPAQLSVATLTEHPDRYLALVRAIFAIRHHDDSLHWLQGDVQHYLPHEIFMTGWGNFQEGSVQPDVVSRLQRVRSYAEGTACLPFLLAKISDCWVSGGSQPKSFSFPEFSYLLGGAFPDSFCGALRRMGSAVVHGISDQRGQNDCVYVFVSSKVQQSDGTGEALSARVEALLPFIDIALRQVSHLPEQRRQAANSLAVKAATDDAAELSKREAQMAAWVAMGKAHPEIGSIMNISGFAVKNHMQRIFQKLNVLKRAQAVSRVTRVSQYV